MDEYQNPCNATGALSRDSSGISPNMSMIFFLVWGFGEGEGRLMFFISPQSSVYGVQRMGRYYPLSYL